MNKNDATPFSNVHFAAWCQQMVGQPYWYGTCVYKCSESLRSRKAEQYPSHYKDGRTSRYKQDIAAKMVCADCVGAVKGYAWTDGGKGVLEAIGTNKSISSRYGSNGCPDKGANSMFTYAKDKGMDWGSIDTLPEIVGLALHMNGHIGYYIGDGYAVEWRGFDYGCVKTKVSDRDWKYWYKLPFIDYGDVSALPPEPETKPDSITVVIVSNGGKVNVRVGNGTHFPRISLVTPGTTFDYVATAANGWNAVLIGTRVGWVSGQYSRII